MLEQALAGEIRQAVDDNFQAQVEFTAELVRFVISRAKKKPGQPRAMI